ncbi:PTS system mannose-specific EIID component [bioreactor metagenome]|uniref:PTS system mannose-specific EIID component n=1 Tax=bioreactor metagenome TaxID=1076179 RepID=A0A645GFJ7_9ZZZZ
MGNIILGACLAIESTKDQDATRTAVELRTGLMGPLAGLGDSIIWILPMTILGAIAAYQALAGSIMGYVIAEVIQLVIWFTFNRLFFVAYEQGVTFVTNKSEQLKNFTEAASVIGLAVVGALIASTVKVNFAVMLNYGEVSQSLNDLLNTIVPRFGNIVTVLAIYWGLGKKGMTSGKMVLILVIAGILLAAAGILG